MDTKFWLLVFRFSLFVSGTMFFMSGCTELAEDISQHPEGWADSTNVNLHGEKISYSGISSCASCHGDDYRGGSSGVSCSECHASGRSGHPVGFTNRESPVFHGYVFWENGWDFSLSRCQACHGDDFEGGTVSFGCSRSWCHASERGIEACDNCHSNGTEIVFEDVRNHTSTDSITVGAHTSHIKAEHSLTQPIDCSECHIVPDSLFAEGHLDSDGMAEITFGLFASDSGQIVPIWNRDNASCSQTYCHGNFSFAKSESENQWVYEEGFESITGNDTTAIWVESGFAECGSCHGLPPTGHNSNFTLCGVCHNSVVGEDNFTIIDSTKHINGKINYP